MLLQRIISSARVGAKGIHPERNVMVIAKRGRGNKYIYATKGDELSPALIGLYAGIFLAGSLAGPLYFFVQFRLLRDKREQNR